MQSVKLGGMSVRELVTCPPELLTSQGRLKFKPSEFYENQDKKAHAMKFNAFKLRACSHGAGWLGKVSWLT